MSYRFLFVEDKHPAKPGTVTVAGEPNLDVPPGTLNSIQASGIERTTGHLQELDPKELSHTPEW